MAKTGRPSNKGLNAFVADWMIRNLFGTVYEAAQERDIAQATLESLGDMDRDHKIYAQILELSEKMDMDPGELMRGILEGKNRPPVARQDIVRTVKSRQALSEDADIAS